MLRSLAMSCRFGLWGWLVLLPSAALADTLDSFRAEALFVEGRALLKVNEYARACGLLAESYRLDPATGSLLALALCDEQQGKLASALESYEQVQWRAHMEGQTEREQVARARAEALRPVVSTLTVHASTTDNRLEVRMNERVLSAAELNVALPVDGGTVHVEAVAPGKQTWRTDLPVAPAGDATELSIPELAALTPLVVAGNGRDYDVVPPRPDDARSLRKRRAGIGLLVSGTTGLAVGVALVVRAVRLDDASDADCVGDVCGAQGWNDRMGARRAAHAATASLAVGAAAAGAGLLVHLLAKRGYTSRERSAGSVAWWAGLCTAGVSLRRSF